MCESNTSSENTELVVVDKRHTAIAPAGQIALSPMQELQMQIVRTGDLEKLKELRAIEKEWREDQAKQAFNAAFSDFKAEAIKLIRTKEITDGPLKGQKHVVLGEVVRVATPALSKHGLSISWKLTRDEKDWMEVTCVLRHVDGHSESVSMGGAPDAGPGRNAIQARGSAKTYLERYTATAILGLAPEDDDDGAATEPAQWIDDYCTAINNATDQESCYQIYKEAYKKAEAIPDKRAMDLFIKTKNTRKAQLQKAGK